MSKDWLDIAQVASGAAAAIALIVTLIEILRRGLEKEREVAEKVLAWSVYEAGPDGSESADGGVLIMNGSAQVALTVDVKTRKATGVDEGGEPGRYEDDKTQGQRFGLIPPGTYYLPQSAIGWQAPALVDTSGGKFAFTRNVKGRQEVIHLVPITERPEPRRVFFLRYTLAGHAWHRDVDGVLGKGAGSGDWDDEFTASESQRLESVVAPYQPNPSVQALIERLFTHFAVEGVSPAPNATADVKPEFKRLGISTLRRTRGKGQGLRLFCSDPLDHRYYISGGHDATFPNDGFQFQNSSGDAISKSAFPVPSQPATYWVDHFDELTAAIVKGIEDMHP